MREMTNEMHKLRAYLNTANKRLRKLELMSDHINDEIRVLSKEIEERTKPFEEFYLEWQNEQPIPF